MDATRLWSLLLDDAADAMDIAMEPMPPPLPLASSLLLFLLLQHGEARRDVNTRIWKFPRHSTHWEDLQRLMAAVDEPTLDAHWRAYYRMSHAVFQNLVEEIRPFIAIGSCDYVRAPVELDKAVAMVLHRLAHGHSAAVVGDMYNTGPSTVGKYTQLVTEVLANRDKLYAKYVRVPEGVALTRVINRFKSLTQLPNACGAIGGTHIKLSIRPPKQYGPKDYWSTKHFIFSVLLQCVCDCDLVFWDVCCNAPGGQQNASHFAFCPLWRKLASRELLSWPRVKVKGLEVQPYLVGDSSYRSAPFLVKPLGNVKLKNRSEAQVMEFDRLIKRGHEKVEEAFGALKSRWKILRNLNAALTNAAQVSVACCVLHNICQMSGEPVAGNFERDDFPNNNTLPRGPIDAQLLASGRSLRDALFQEWVELKAVD